MLSLETLPARSSSPATYSLGASQPLPCLEARRPQHLPLSTHPFLWGEGPPSRLRGSGHCPLHQHHRRSSRNLTQLDSAQPPTARVPSGGGEVETAFWWLKQELTASCFQETSPCASVHEVVFLGQAASSPRFVPSGCPLHWWTGWARPGCGIQGSTQMPSWGQLRGWRCPKGQSWSASAWLRWAPPGSPLSLPQAISAGHFPA